MVQSNMENTSMDFKIWGTDLPAKSLNNSCKVELVLEGGESILKMDMERKCKFSFFALSRSEDRISLSLGWSLSRKCQSKCLQNYTKFITVPLNFTIFTTCLFLSARGSIAQQFGIILIELGFDGAFFGRSTVTSARRSRATVEGR